MGKAKLKYTNGAPSEGTNTIDEDLAALMTVTFRYECDVCEDDGFNIALDEGVVLCKTCLDFVYNEVRARAKQRVEM